MGNLVRWVMLSALAFFAGYRGTDWVFRAKLVPLPFEPVGIVVGAALVFLTWGTMGLIQTFSGRKERGDSMKKLLGAVLAFLLVAAPLAPVFAETDSEKLDRILTELQEIKSELQIVKIRATQK